MYDESKIYDTDLSTPLESLPRLRDEEDLAMAHDCGMDANTEIVMRVDDEWKAVIQTDSTYMAAGHPLYITMVHPNHDSLSKMYRIGTNQYSFSFRDYFRWAVEDLIKIATDDEYRQLCREGKGEDLSQGDVS